MTDKKRWNIQKTSLEYKNRIFKIFRKDVITPDGNLADYYVLNKYTAFFSIVIPLSEDRQTYLVGQYRIAPDIYSWEFPMGGVIGKDRPLDVAKQELKEETGLIAKMWHQIGSFYVASGHSDQKAYVFTAEGLIQKQAEPEPNEFLEVKSIPISSVATMIHTGQITNGPTICAYQYYLLNKQKG